MVTISQVRRKFGGLVCRRCVNAAFNARLLSSDCLYESGEASYCPGCDGTHHIVSGFRLSGKLKLLFKK